MFLWYKINLCCFINYNSTIVYFTPVELCVKCATSPYPPPIISYPPLHNSKHEFPITEITPLGILLLIRGRGSNIEKIWESKEVEWGENSRGVVKENGKWRGWIKGKGDISSEISTGGIGLSFIQVSSQSTRLLLLLSFTCI